MYSLTEREQWLCGQIVDSCYKIHYALGPCLLEKIYEVCLSHELNKREINSQRQVVIPINYDGIVFEEALRLDMLVENTIICEIKAVEAVNKVWEAQILSQLKMTGKHVGFLINFNVPKIKEGIRRYCL